MEYEELENPVLSKDSFPETLQRKSLQEISNRIGTYQSNLSGSGYPRNDEVKVMSSGQSLDDKGSIIYYCLNQNESGKTFGGRITT